MNEEKHRLKKFNKMMNRYKNGYYNKLYKSNMINDILIFERPNGKKNCFNLSGFIFEINDFV